jgi:hypothetical protein
MRASENGYRKRITDVIARSVQYHQTNYQDVWHDQLAIKTLTSN